jgi:hypothetical protein
VKWFPIALENDNPDPFIQLPDDEQPGLSKEDIQFLDLMDERLCVNDEGFLQFPLPLKDRNAQLPNNYHGCAEKIFRYSEPNEAGPQNASRMR